MKLNPQKRYLLVTLILVFIIGSLMWASVRSITTSLKQRESDLFQQHLREQLKIELAARRKTSDPVLAEYYHVFDYHLTGNCVKASEAAKVYLEKYPDGLFHESVHWMYGRASYCLGNYPLALTELQLAVQLDGDEWYHLDAHQYLADLYCLIQPFPKGTDITPTDKLQIGLQHALKSVEVLKSWNFLQPAENARPYLLAGACYFQMAKQDNARSYIMKAIEFDPNAIKLEQFQDIFEKLKIVRQ